jgi:hypothetical protein
MTMAKDGTPEVQVKVTISRVEPTPSQLAAWRRLWDHLLASESEARRS